MGITLKECVRGGLLGAAAAAAFSGTLAAALVSSAPSVSPSLAAAHAAPHPTITVSPTSGGPGTVVTIVGKGFVPPPAAMGEAGSQLKYGNPPSSGGGPISSTGRFKGTLKVVSTDRRGKNVVEVMEQYSCSSAPDGVCSVVATAQFTVK